MSSTVLSRRPPSRSRAEWYADAKLLHDQGMNMNEIARELGISRSFASGLINDPDGSKDRERKKRYSAMCIVCEGPCERTAVRCAPCQLEWQRDQKYWTRERVIDAIRRFAAVHGRPPKSDEWIKSDPVNGYPPRSQVYQAGRLHKSAPFKQWSDAIVAAGFERPTRGYRREGLKGLSSSAMRALELARTHGYVTTAMLADALGISRENALKVLRSPVGRGLLTVRRGLGVANVYEPVE